MAKQKRVCTHPERTRRQESAALRKAKRDNRSNVEQIRELDGRLGRGQGATKERARLTGEAA